MRSWKSISLPSSSFTPTPFFHPLFSLSLYSGVVLSFLFTDRWRNKGNNGSRPGQQTRGRCQYLNYNLCKINSNGTIPPLYKHHWRPTCRYLIIFFFTSSFYVRSPGTVCYDLLSHVRALVAALHYRKSHPRNIRYRSSSTFISHLEGRTTVIYELVRLFDIFSF